MKTNRIFTGEPSSKWAVVLLSFLLVILTGCQAIRYMVYMLTPAGKGEWIEAKSEALTEGKRVLILVYADESIQYMHQHLARFDTAAVTAKELQSQLKVDVVDPAVVEHFQEANVDWAEQPLSWIAERYKADYILYIELLTFTTSVEESGELARGQVEGSCSLYSSDHDSSQLWQGKVKALYPKAPVVADLGVTDRIRYETLELFAERLVKNFYGHHEPL